MIDINSRHFNRRALTRLVTTQRTWRDLTLLLNAERFDELHRMGALKEDETGHFGVEVEQEDGSVLVCCELTQEAWHLACRMAS